MALTEWVEKFLGNTQEEVRECIDKSLYFRLLDLSPDAIIFYTDEAGCIGANEKFLKFFGFTSLDDFISRSNSLQQLFSDEDDSVISESDTIWLGYISRVHRKGYGVRYVDANENVKHMLLYVETIEHNDNTLFYVTMKSAEDIYDLQSRLIESDTKKREFLSEIGLQFRTPMQSILGFVNLLQKSHLDTMQETYLKQVSLSARDLIANMENLLDTQNASTNTIKPSQMYFEIELRTLVASFEQKTLEKKLTLAFESDEAIPEVIEGDVRKLKQLLFQMLTYAIEIAAPSSTLTLSCTSQSDDRVLIAFDTIISATVNEPRDDKLILIRKLASLLKGELEVDYGDATQITLHVTLPFGDVAYEAPLAEAHREERVRVLVVEDNVINQNLMRLLLEGYGIDVAVASNGQEAIDIEQNDSFDLIFMDIDMPLVNGIEATQQIKKHRRDAPLFMPIIAVTALALEGDRERLLSEGLDDYLSKPLSREMLELILKKYLNIGV